VVQCALFKSMEAIASTLLPPGSPAAAAFARRLRLDVHRVDAGRPWPLALLKPHADELLGAMPAAELEAQARARARARGFGELGYVLHRVSLGGAEKAQQGEERCVRAPLNAATPPSNLPNPRRSTPRWRRRRRRASGAHRRW